MTSTLYKIVYAVDFSIRSVLAAPCVTTWINRSAAALDIVHVTDPGALAMAPDYQLRYLTERRMADLKHFSDRYFGENVASCAVVRGA